MTPLPPSVSAADEAADGDFWDLAEERPAAVVATPAEAPVAFRAPAAQPSAVTVPFDVSVATVVEDEPIAAAETAPGRDVLLHRPPARARAPLSRHNGQTLVTGTERRDAIEQYRKLAATLHHVQANRNIRVVLCTSAWMAEGKTVTAANLALTLSQSFKRRVLLIDGDLRRPRLHTLFNVPNEEGLFEALGARVDRKIPVANVSPTLSVVTAGRPGPDPVHVLTSERLQRVIEDAGASYDWVIIDAPPVLVLPDAGLLMAVVDAAVMVVASGQTSHSTAKRAVEAIGRDRIIGVVINRAQDDVLHADYGGYYGYYADAPRRD